MPGSVSGPSSLRPASRAASTPAATVRPASPRPRKPGRACSRFISPMRSSRRLSATHPGASPSTCATSSRPCDGSRGGASAANSARGASPFLADAASACAHEARPWPRPSMLASGGARCSLHVRLDESSGRGERTDHDVHRRSAPRSSAEAWDIRGLRRPRPAPAPPQPAPRRSRGHRARRTRARARRVPPRRPAKSPRPWIVHVASDRPRPFVVIRVRRKTVSEIDAPAIENVAAGGDRDEHRRIAMLGDADGRGSLRSCSRHAVLLGR